MNAVSPFSSTVPILPAGEPKVTKKVAFVPEGSQKKGKQSGMRCCVMIGDSFAPFGDAVLVLVEDCPFWQLFGPGRVGIRICLKWVGGQRFF